MQKLNEMDLPFELPEIAEFSEQGYTILGRTLAYATSYESNCKSLATLIGLELDHNLLNTEDHLNEFLAFMQKRKLFAQIKDIVNKTNLHHSIPEILHSGREARNFIAHESSIGVFQLFERDDRDTIIKELREKTIKIADANLIILLLGQKISDEPIPTLSFLNSYPKKVADWVCRIE
jgi:hypothetical protein